MKTQIFIAIFSCLFVRITYGQELTKDSLKANVKGDLDNDGVDELVTVSLNNELVIYKKEKDNWKRWKTPKCALLGTEDGGMQGDPFGGVSISKGILVISHQGGSSWSWSYTDTYKYLNGDFFLVEHSHSYGQTCTEWKEYDIDFSTGKITYKKTQEECEDGNPDKMQQTIIGQETFYKKGISISLDERNCIETKITTPKGETLYLN